MVENIIGKKYNHWTVVALVESADKDKKVECVCDCGTRRIVSKKNILSGSSSSCGCSRKQSRKCTSFNSKIKNADTKGEKLIEKALIAAGGIFVNNIKNLAASLPEEKFIFEKQVKVCEYDTRFSFDFMVYAEKMIAIEFDGGFHFKPVFIKGDNVFEFIMRHERDLRKDAYCETMEIPLLRIRYDQEDKIEELVNDVLLNPNKYVKEHNFEGAKYYDEWKKAFSQMRQKSTVSE